MNDVINPGKTITKTATAAKKSLEKWNHLLSIFNLRDNSRSLTLLNVDELYWSWIRKNYIQV